MNFLQHARVLGRGILRCSWDEVSNPHQLEVRCSKLVREQLLRTTSSLVYASLLLVGDYVRFDTSLNFIITNFHTKLKPEVKVSYDMNSLPHTQRLSDHSWLVSHTALISFSETEIERIVSLWRFVDFAGLLLSYSSKA